MKAVCLSQKYGILAVSCLLFFVFVPLAHAGNWPQFRGPNGTGVSTEKNIPVTWSSGDYKWDVAIEGVGHAAPIIWGDSVFVTSAEDSGAVRHLVCLDVKSGQKRWTRSIGMNRSKKHEKSSWASSTPATDGDLVFSAFADKESYLVDAYNFDGELVWRRNLGPFESQHGLGVSLILFEDSLIVPNDQDGPSFITALDKKTGKTKWISGGRSFREASYSTPIVVQEKGKPAQLICPSGAMGITGLDPQTGALNWRTEEFPLRTVASPVYGAGLIIASCGQGGRFGVKQIAVDPFQTDEDGHAVVKWTREKLIPYVPTPIVLGEHLFEWSDQGIITCVALKTGKDVWTHRMGGNYSGSPLCIDGKLYGIEENGKVVVIEAGPAFKQLGTADLGDGCHSTPAVANGRLFLRTFERLKCLEAKRE